MADVTKKRFYAMLECGEDPEIGSGERGKSGRCIWSDVFLRFSTSKWVVLDRMKEKGIAPLIAIEPFMLVLGTCRGQQHGMGVHGRYRLDRKVAKYSRWLEAWLAAVVAEEV